ncbi:transcription factor HES-7-like [Carassius auratus]|uniref:Transcription factor HES-7-like n=1 Tax=Carassius auratus TaxID=7957 RepID=A0A6P6LAN4_CARAU|nr:transcription factor HES-7-like [Carassius auratus]
MGKEAADIRKQKDSKRVSKPLMEKRRRDRINQSLETLRMLLFENTHNEKLKNPKVEKAEILESVVNFLRAEQGLGTESFQITRGKGAYTEESDEDLSSQRQSYPDGMRACLIRVSNFIASKSHEFRHGVEKACENLNKAQPMQVQLLSAPSHRETQVLLYEDSSLPAQQHPTHVQLSNSCTPSGCAKLAQRTVMSAPTTTSSPKQPVMLCDAVWRPW